MDDTSPKPNSSTQANIDDLVKELSRTQSVPVSPSGTNPSPAPAPKPAAPAPVMPAKPAMPAPAPVSSMPKPAVPAPTPAPAAPQQYQSNIRTMSDDLSRLKSGQQPQGTVVPRTVAPAAPTSPAPAPKPAAPAPVMPAKPAMPAAPAPVKPMTPVRPAPAPMPTPSVPKPVAPAPVMPPKPVMPLPSAPKPAVPAPAAPGQKDQFYVPDSTGSVPNRRNILFAGIAVLVVVFAVAYWYFLIRQPAQVAVESPIVTFTPRPTPTPVTNALLAAFPIQGNASNVVLPTSGDPSKAFNTYLSTVTVAPGQFQQVNITSGASNSLNTAALLDRFLVSYPAGLKAQFGSDYRALAYGQKESFDTKGHLLTTPAGNRLVLISEIASSSDSLLQSWEPNMTTGLAGLLGYNKTKNTKGFTANTYIGTPVRYKNFPYPDRSIDYAVLTVNGKYYLVLAASREAMFATLNAFSSATH